jgi:serine phosphatase RsbU (regulator of sigma subunit)
MFKLKKIRFGIHFSGVIIISLSVFMVIIAIVAMISMREIGAYTVSSLEKRVSHKTASLFFKNTQRKAEEYSNIFNKVCALVKLTSEQVILNINSVNNYDFNDIKIQKYCNTFENSSGNGPLINSTKSGTLTVYTGKEKCIPKKLQKFFYSLSLLDSLLKQVYLANPYYFSSWIWFCDNNSITVYSKNNGYRKILSTDKGYKDFINQVEVISGGAGADNKVKLTDKYKNILGVSVLTAVYRHYNSRGNLVFVTGIDINMDMMVNDIINNKVPIFEYGKLMNKGKDINSFDFIVSSKSGQIILSSYGQDNILKFGSLSKLKGKDGFSTFSLNNENYFLTYRKLSINDWYLGVAVLGKNHLSGIQRSVDKINKNFFDFEINFFLVFAFFLLLTILALIVFFRKYIIKPISKLRSDVFKMGRGNFDLTIRPKGKGKGVREIADLAESFNTLGHKIDKYTKELKLEVVERNRREKEMQIAKRIQQSVLPRVTPTFGANKISLYGRLHPAKNVAGDFYDFFFLSRKRLVVLIADVSGKGVSAAFYMTIAKRTIRNACINEPDDPAKALCLSNELLCEYNLKMFVSVFLIYYDLGTGQFCYGNAGHNEPVILKRSGENNFFGSQHDMVLGIFPDLKFHTGKESFEIGETLVLYTDGITEANASNEDYFGEERLIKFLAKNRELSTKSLCRSLIANVHRFEKGTQYDDMTVLTLKRKN